jgi:hypothetical protein
MCRANAFAFFVVTIHMKILPHDKSLFANLKISLFSAKNFLILAKVSIRTAE